MINFESFVLPNGLRVVVHEDSSVRIAVMNLLYDVGSRDEEPSKTGLAHLLEHLMFGGSVHIPHYDKALQKVGGTNNAFTNTDVTNYYLTVAADNIETGFWLESDRMLGLSFDSKILEAQKKVVVEEFKQRYLNQPYGDVWLKLFPLAYRVHPYRWPTIGKETAHIESVTMQEVNTFFRTYYTPDNAILVVAGNLQTDKVKRLAKKWFGPIPIGDRKERQLPVEPPQEQRRTLELAADVPADMLYKVYHMQGRFHNDFYATDLLATLLGQGDASRLYRKLVEENQIFTSISSFTTGTIDPGLMAIVGMVKEGVDLEQAAQEVDAVVYELMSQAPSEGELEKAKNQTLADLSFGEVEILNRAIGLAFATLSGRTNLVNEERDKLTAVSIDDVKRIGKQIFREENSSQLFYWSKTQKSIK